MLSDLRRLPLPHLERIQRQALGDVTLQPRNAALREHYELLTNELHRRRRVASGDTLARFPAPAPHSTDRDAA